MVPRSAASLVMLYLPALYSWNVNIPAGGRLGSGRSQRVLSTPPAGRSTGALRALRASEGEADELDKLSMARLALQAAIQVEDYAEAARLKKEIDASEERTVVEEDEASAGLVDSKSIDQMLQSAGKEGIVVLHFTSAAQDFANSIVGRTASRYAASQMVGGPVCGFVQLSEQGFERLGTAQVWSDPRDRSTPVAAPPPPPAGGMLPGWKAVEDKSSGRTYYYDTKTKETSWEKPVTEAYRAAAKLCAERGIRSLPCTQVWVGGALIKEVSSSNLEAELLALGAKCAAGSAATGTERYRDRNVGTGLPSADAVDDIDFTGGIAGAGGTNLDRFKGRDRGTTRSYLPDLVDKPGDDLKKGGNEPPSGPPETLKKGPNWNPKKPSA